jgi:hypothetical protein
MRLPWFQPLIAAGFLIGCTSQSSIKPAEVLDERTGMTVAALQEPIELVQSAQLAAVSSEKRASFAYLGPIEWDQMGHISYGLWINVAPGNDRQVADIRTPGAVSLALDDGPVGLVIIDAPKPGRNPYQPVVPWGQTAYFELNAELLKRMAASHKLDLNIRTVDDSTASFSPSRGTHTTLTQFAQARGIATLD